MSTVFQLTPYSTVFALLNPAVQGVELVKENLTQNDRLNAFVSAVANIPPLKGAVQFPTLQVRKVRASAVPPGPAYATDHANGGTRAPHYVRPKCRFSATHAVIYSRVCRIGTVPLSRCLFGRACIWTHDDGVYQDLRIAQTDRQIDRQIE